MTFPIDSIEALQAHVKQGRTDFSEYGMVNTKLHPTEPLILLAYNNECQTKRSEDWNFLERVSRGIILELGTGDIIARPFDKFFSWGQEELADPTAYIVEIAEKADGSLGVAHFYNHEWRVSTRGSFNSDQALWATDFLRENCDMSSVSPDLTFLVEIIYPENQIVVDYEGREELILLGIRNRKTGAYADYFAKQLYADCGFPLPRFWSAGRLGVDALLEKAQTLPGNEEGFVVQFSNGQRFKIKGSEYLKLHRFISHFSFKRVLEVYQQSQEEFRKFSDACPDQYRAIFNDMVRYILGTIIRVRAEVNKAVDDCCEALNIFSLSQIRNAPYARENRKLLADYILANHKELASYLFALADGKDWLKLIIEREFNDHPFQKKVSEE